MRKRQQFHVKTVEVLERREVMSTSAAINPLVQDVFAEYHAFQEFNNALFRRDHQFLAAATNNTNVRSGLIKASPTAPYGVRFPVIDLGPLGQFGGYVPGLLLKTHQPAGSRSGGLFGHNGAGSGGAVRS